MIVLGPLIQIVIFAIGFYIWLVIGSAILSWLVAFSVVNTSNRFVFALWDFMHKVTEPALRPIRRFLPNLGGVDISPVVLILLLYFCEMVLRNILWELRGAAL